MQRMTSQLPSLVLLTCLLGLSGGCDRKIEPYDPAERPQPPDLSRIFPAGAELAARASEPPDAVGMPARGAPPVLAAGEPVRGTIRLATDFEGTLPANPTLFLIARPEAGGPPLAVKRIQEPRFPLDFEIGPGDRMIEEMPFAGPLLLSARIDGDGNASTRAAGDLQGTAAAPVAPGATGVDIVLDEIL